MGGKVPAIAVSTSSLLRRHCEVWGGVMAQRLRIHIAGAEDLILGPSTCVTWLTTASEFSPREIWCFCPPQTPAISSYTDKYPWLETRRLAESCLSVKSTGYFHRGPAFDNQCPTTWGPTMVYTQLQKIWCLLLPFKKTLKHTVHRHTCWQDTCVHKIHIIIKSKVKINHFCCLT